MPAYRRGYWAGYRAGHPEYAQAEAERQVERRRREAAIREQVPDPPFSDAVLQVIRAQLAELGGQAGVARTLAIDPSTIKRWLGGSRHPASAELDAIVAAFGLEAIAAEHRRGLREARALRARLIRTDVSRETTVSGVPDGSGQLRCAPTGSRGREPREGSGAPGPSQPS